MSRLRITETSLRDGHQSLIATRMTTDEILPILSESIYIKKYPPQLITDNYRL